MAPSATINLIRKAPTVSPQYTALEQSITRIAVVATIVLIVAGSITASVYFYVNGQKTALEDTKLQLLRDISSQSEKEVLHISLKDRADIVGDAFAKQMEWQHVYDMVLSIAAPPVLQGFNLDDTNEMSVNLQATTIEEAEKMVQIVKDLFSRNEIAKPMLASFQLGKDEGIRVSITFYPNSKLL